MLDANIANWVQGIWKFISLQIFYESKTVPKLRIYFKKSKNSKS